jgi:hypothetical protein
VNIEPFYIAFEGPTERAAMLRRIVEELASEKAAHSDGSMIVDECELIIADPKWLDFLDPSALNLLTDANHWPLEDILECILRGEYELLGVEFADNCGRLLYNPFSFPFGGTDSIKAIVEVFGLRVIRDSFHDGFAEWKAAGGR